MITLLDMKKSLNLQIRACYDIFKEYKGSKKDVVIVSHEVEDRIDRPFIFTEMDVLSIIRDNKRHRNMKLKFTCIAALEPTVSDGANIFVSETDCVSFLDILYNNFSSKFLVFKNGEIIRRLEIEDVSSELNMSDGFVTFTIQLDFTDHIDDDEEDYLIDEHKDVEEKKIIEKLDLMESVSMNLIKKGSYKI